MKTDSTSCCGCQDTAATLSASHDRALRRVLMIVMGINLGLFGVEFFAAYWIGSSALQADALDAFGDASVYALSLFVVGRSLRWRAGAALVKGIIQGLFGLLVLFEVYRRLLGEVVPIAPWMLGMAVVALAANLSCFWLLLRYRNEDLNLRSVWLCTRNDVLSNIGVIVAAGAVAFSQSNLPDAIVGSLIALIFLQTSATVIRQSWGELRPGHATTMEQ